MGFNLSKEADISNLILVTTHFVLKSKGFIYLFEMKVQVNLMFRNAKACAILFISYKISVLEK